MQQKEQMWRLKVYQVSCSQFFIFKSIIVVLGLRKIIPYKPINQLTKKFDLYHKINLCLAISFFFKTDEAISSVAVVFQYLPFCQFQAESIHANMSIRSCSCSFWWERMIHMIVNRERECKATRKKICLQCNTGVLLIEYCRVNIHTTYTYILAIWSKVKKDVQTRGCIYFWFIWHNWK